MIRRCFWLIKCYLSVRSILWSKIIFYASFLHTIVLVNAFHTWVHTHSLPAGAWFLIGQQEISFWLFRSFSSQEHFILYLLKISPISFQGANWIEGATMRIWSASAFSLSQPFALLVPFTTPAVGSFAIFLRIWRRFQSNIQTQTGFFNELEFRPLYDGRYAMSRMERWHFWFLGSSSTLSACADFKRATWCVV